MALVFAVLIGLNLYIFVLRPKTSVRELLKTTKLAKQGASAAITAGGPSLPVPPPPKRRPISDDDDLRVVEGVVRPGDTLAQALAAAGLVTRDVNDVLAAL